jgi:hypothetical protein
LFADKTPVDDSRYVKTPVDDSQYVKTPVDELMTAM